MKVENVLSRLRRVRRSGDSWMACCPAHDDRSPSLSISERDGRTLLHCHAGCSTEAVCAALGIEVRELFSVDGPPAQVEAVYGYLDERGELLYEVVRYRPKSFRQRRPDRKGGFVWNLTGVRRVLYRLPEVLAAKSILLCEGEKDCETSRSLGLVATCNPGGAGKWRQDYSEFLRGKRVVIIADADEPGRKHAQDIAVSLLGRVASLKLLELPGAKDLTEWAEHGGKVDALLGLIRGTSDWKPPSQAASGFALTHLGDLLAQPDLPVEYVVENLLVAGTVSCAAAKPKVGKSTFARNLCLCVSRGEPFLGLKTKQGECLYLALEEREEDIKNDFRAMEADGTEPIYIHAATAPTEGISALCDLVRDRRPALVVIDPLFRMAHIRDEKAYAETYSALGPLIDIAREVGTHILLTHHAPKIPKSDPIDAPLGSTAIGGAVCSLLVLKRTESATTVQSVQRIGQNLPETILEFDPESRRVSLGVGKAEADVRAIATGILEYLQVAEGAKTEPEIVEAVEGKTSVKRKALRQLVDLGKVGREGTGRRGDAFKYRFLFSCSPDIPGTREQETEKDPETRINTDDILVPASRPPGQAKKPVEEQIVTKLC